MCENYEEAVTARRVRIVATKQQETDCLSQPCCMIPFRKKPLPQLLKRWLHTCTSTQRPGGLAHCSWKSLLKLKLTSVKKRNYRQQYICSFKNGQLRQRNIKRKCAVT